MLKFSFGFDYFIRVIINNFKKTNNFFYSAKFVIINLVFNIVLDNVYSIKANINNFIVFVIKAIAINLKFGFNIRLLSIKTDITVLRASKLV